jgi:hypothetical protein
LLITLKRFRHDRYRSAKNSRTVSFPLEGLSLAPFMTEDAAPTDSSYKFVAVVSHIGNTNGGHYICLGRTPTSDKWYRFDDYYVAAVDAATVAKTQAYILVYRRVEEDFAARLRDINNILERRRPKMPDVLLSAEWVVLCLNIAQPGEIDNSAFACVHGGILPGVEATLHVVKVPFELWAHFHALYGGGPMVTQVQTCAACLATTRQLAKRRAYEDKMVKKFQQARGGPHYFISSNWAREWRAFVLAGPDHPLAAPPGPIDHAALVEEIKKCDLAKSKTFEVVSSATWHFL